jgi:hypothetical protein
MSIYWPDDSRFEATMDVQLRLLAHARRDELERTAARGRLAGLVSRCRQRVFRFLPITRACQACATC